MTETVSQKEMRDVLGALLLSMGYCRDVDVLSRASGLLARLSVEVRAATDVPLPVGAVIQPFQIGQKVRVSGSYLEEFGEWAGVELWVSGIRIDGKGDWDITVTERWPPESRGDETDGFCPNDLSAV